MVPGSKDYEDEEDSSLSLKAQKCLGETGIEMGGGVWVGYRGVEIEVEAWWGAMWKGGGTNSASGTTEV